jgi:hypothetical protein
MTRSSLRRTLRRIYVLLTLVLAISFFAKIADHVPYVAGTGAEKILKDVYEFLRDMSLLIATGGVAYVTNVFQRRHAFIESLREEWRDIIQAKSAILQFMHKSEPTHAEYVATFTRLSETIDNMRIVYRNVGETRDLIGLYPFAPLHDMRRVLQTLDPKDEQSRTVDRKLARDAMLQSFYALREHFLEELDLEEPDEPLLMAGARRMKRPGSLGAARRLQDRQIARQRGNETPAELVEADRLLDALYQKERDKGGATNGTAAR